MARIFFNDLQTQSVRHKKELLKGFSRVLSRGVFLHGKEEEILTQKFRHVFKRNALLVGSGHDALTLSLRALHLHTTDEVIVPVNAYPTAFAVEEAKAKLIFADVTENGQLSVETIEAVRTQKTKVVILVHLYGLTSDVMAISKYCKKHRLILIEDCAQAYGTKIQKNLVGTIGDIGCFSFYPTKNLGSLGDGGLVITKDKRIHETIRHLASYGEKRRYESYTVSGHSRLPELQAAGLRVYVSKFQKDAQKRRQVALWYTNEIATRNLNRYVRVLISHTNSVPIHHLFVVAVQKRPQLQLYLHKKNIPTHIHYPLPTHKAQAFKHVKHKTHAFPVAMKLAKEIISLPYHPSLTRMHVIRVVETIHTFYETHK